MLKKIVFILMGFWLPLYSGAVELSVGIGLSDGRDNASLQQDYARLQQDIRALRALEHGLESLARQEQPSSLQDEEKAEWQSQSGWLLAQAGKVTELVDEAEGYLQESRHTTRSPQLFDYQAAKFKTARRLDAIEDAAKEYTVRGEAAAERQNRAVKLVVNTF